MPISGRGLLPADAAARAGSVPMRMRRCVFAFDCRAEKRKRNIKKVKFLCFVEKVNFVIFCGIQPNKLYYSGYF